MFEINVTQHIDVYDHKIKEYWNNIIMGTIITFR